MLPVLVAGLVGAGLILLLDLWRGKARQRVADASLLLLQNQISTNMQQTSQTLETVRQSFTHSLEGLGTRLSLSLADGNRQVGDSLQSTGQVLGDLRQKLGRLEESSRHMVELGRDIAGLEEILRPPKLRGALGEWLLAELLGQILPTDCYRLQYAFKGGQVVDAVIVLRNGLVPIDAKFPLDNFRKMLEASSDEDRAAATKAFSRDVRNHIDAIATKYIRTDENTFDFALMYIPAENVYYEAVVRSDGAGGGGSLFDYALSKRVVAVSPNSFYAYLQTILLGLKGMRVEQQSREILDRLASLNQEFGRFAEAFRLVGQHLDNSQKKYAEAQTSLGKVEARVDAIDGLTKGLQSQEAPLPPTAGASLGDAGTEA